MAFGIQLQSFFGTAGEFRIKGEHGEVVAQYVQTRIRPALDGQWDSILTQHMKPWREIFSIERMSFDELLQRDLDDARVANDLIPYLMGGLPSRYPVFPPILAVLAPKATGHRSGIERFYPKPTNLATGGRKFGSVFEIHPYMVNGDQSPITEIRYNEHQTSFVIVDGQHRAMAVLALFKQLQGSSAWGASPYASYYSHFTPSAEQVSHIQLPVCVLFFPEIFEGSLEYERTDADLLRVCRQIFLDVNKRAQQVSRSRELLLDDSRFPAMLMRRVLTQIKDLQDCDGDSMIQTVDYARDDASDSDRTVVTAPTEYTSSHAIHVSIGALCFCNPDALPLTSSTDVTSGRYRRNGERPAFLLGERTRNKTISAHHAQRMSQNESSAIADALASLWSPVVPGMFSRLRPYRIHNDTLRSLSVHLSGQHVQANAALTEAKGMIFSGGGERVVFERHVKRLEKIIDENEYSAFRSKSVIQKNHEHCLSVRHALSEQFSWFRTQRAFRYYNIDAKRVPPDSSEGKKVVQKANFLFTAFSTQALQLGYVMLHASLLNYLDGDSVTYEERKAVIRFFSDILHACLDSFLAPSDEIVRHSVTQGLFSESRSDAFSPNRPGFRGLYSGPSGQELNEKAWRFFRYAFLEIMFSRGSLIPHGDVLRKASSEIQKAYHRAVQSIVSDLVTTRSYWSDKFVEKGVRHSAFKTRLMELEISARTSGESDEGVKKKIDDAIDGESKRLRSLARSYLVASIGTPVHSKDIISALFPSKLPSD